jgi:peptide/nickel transport system substrate-binding protein
MHVHGMRRRGGIAAALLAGALALAGCGGGGGESGGDTGAQVQQGGTLNYAADQEPTGFNVNTSADNGTAARNVTIQVLPQLFNQTPKYEYQLGQAFESAELTSENPQTVTIKIKPDAKWSDGKDISADDIIYMWEQQNGTKKDNDVASTTGYEDIESVTGSDGGKTATIVFKKPFADWKSLFTDILPSHVIKTAPGGWNTAFKENLPVSGGAFKIESFTRGQQLILARNDAFWGEKPKLDKIVFRILPESVTQPAALKNREVDMIYAQPQLDMVSEIKAQPDLQSIINFGLSYEHLDFNFKNEHLAKKEVRQAIALGIDRDEIVRRTVAQFDSKATRLDNRVWVTGQPQYKANGAEYAKRDTAKAEQLLQQAGYTKGGDGIYAAGGKKLSLRISTTAGNALREQQVELVQQQLKEIGIDIKIANMPSTDFFGKALPNGDFDIGNFAWVSGLNSVSSNKAIFTLPSESNYGSYDNPQVKTMFEQAIAELDPAKAADLANQIDQIIWDDVATIPLYTKPNYLAYRNTVANVGENGTNDGPFWNSWSFGLKAAAQ